MLVNALIIILVILAVVNIYMAIKRIYFPQITRMTCTAIELPQIKGERVDLNDEFGLVYPTEIEINSDLFDERKPKRLTLEQRAYAPPERDLSVSEQASIDSAIAEAFPEPPKPATKVFTFEDSTDATNRKHYPVQRRSVLGRQERDGYD